MTTPKAATKKVHYVAVELKFESDSEYKFAAKYEAEKIMGAIGALLGEAVEQVSLGATAEEAFASLGYVKKA